MPGLLQIAVIFFAYAAQHPSSQMRPLRLHVEQQGDATIFRVIGLANAPSSVPYDLQVTDGGNMSAQRGVARLQAGVPTTVATVRLTSSRQLSATLNVKPSANTEYDEKFGPSAP